MVSKCIPKKKTHKIMKQELLKSLKEHDNIEQPGLNEINKETNDPREAITIIDQSEEIIKSNNKNKSLDI